MDNYVKPFEFWCQKVIPLVYDDSLSYYEVVCKMVTKLNEMAQSINSLAEIIAGLDGMITGLVEKVLNKMIADGTLESLINDTLLNQKLDKDAPRSSLDLDLKWRWLFDDGRYTKVGNPFSFCQGFEMIDDQTFVMCLVPSEPAASLNRNMVLINKYSMGNPNSVASVQAPYGHANSCTYLPSKNQLLINFRFNYNADGSTTASNMIGIIDYEKFAVSGLKDLGMPIQSIAVDRWNNNIYVTSGGFLYIYDDDWNQLDMKAIPEFGGNIIQSIAVCKGNVYVMYAEPYNFTVYNSKMEIIMRYSLPNYISGVIRVREPEDLTVFPNGQGYMNFVSYLSDNFFKVNNTVAGFNVLTSQHARPTWNANNAPLQPTNFYVNGMSLVTDPDGSQAKPFRYVQEAIIANNSEWWNGCYINLTNFVGEVGPIQIAYNKNPIRIRGGGNMRITGAVLNFTHNVTIEDCTLTGEYTPGSKSAPVVAYGSDFHISGCTITPVSGVTQGIYLGRECNCTVRNTSITSANKIQIRQASRILYDKPFTDNIEIIDGSCDIKPAPILYEGNNNTIGPMTTYNPPLNFKYLRVQGVIYSMNFDYTFPAKAGYFTFGGSNISANQTLFQLVEFMVRFIEGNTFELSRITTYASGDTPGPIDPIPGDIYVSRLVGLM